MPRPVRLLAGWCELRRVRHFRTARILAADFPDERHDRRPAALRTRWERVMDAERGLRSP